MLNEPDYLHPLVNFNYQGAAVNKNEVWCENGNIIFDGRIDNQIKIRGYRVELGEIEAAVKQELEVSEAAALLREVKGEKVICLYVQGSDVGKETIYEKLSKRLPIYLVPSRIKIMDKLPIKSNGKIDMDKLEIPEVIKNIDGDQDYEKYEADIPAYVIYTSGSTGNPKGVVVNNRNIVNEIFWHIKEAELNENTIFVQNTAFIFDGSVIEIFSALLCGGRLRLVSDTDRKEPEMFLKRIKDANIYILPSMFRAVMDYAITNGLEKELNSYHRLGLVAEKIPEDLIERYLQIDGSNLKNVWNLYGPTETTITASFYYLNENMDYKHIPIGRPITNYNIFILNGNSLCGHGVVGEICISGVGVSEGYINNKEMTEKVFVDNPFGNWRYR